jgi:excisionase family DNA binding protein
VSERLRDADYIAELLDVPATWVREHARAGTIPHYRLGRYVRFRESEVLAWVDESLRAGGRPVQFRRYDPRTNKSPRTAATAGGATPKE